MNAPIVWIILPGVLAGATFFVRRWKRALTVFVTSFTFSLAVLAWFAPIGELITIGPWVFTLSSRFLIAGRQFVLGNADRPMLILVYLTLAFFFAGSLAARVSKLFVPLGLAMGAVLIASLSVRPFLYAALLIEIAVLIGVPLLSPPGRKIQRGVLRYLTFLSFGLPFLLFAGWLLADIGDAVLDPETLLPVIVFLGFGFAFLLAIFPLNTWIPMLAGETHPYGFAFILVLLPIIVMALLQRFLSAYPWLLEFEVIRFSGLLMVVTGGLWAAFQRNLGRLLGYGVIVELGRSLLLLSQPSGQLIYTTMLLPRILVLGVWALSLSILCSKVDNLRFSTVQGAGRRFPLIALGILTAHFSLAGFPLLANFSFLLAAWNQLVQISFVVVLWAILGSVGLMVGALRSLAVLVMGPEELPWEGRIDRTSQVLLIAGLVSIMLVGLFPQWAFAFMDALLTR